MKYKLKQALVQLHELRKQNNESISQMTTRIEGTNQILAHLSTIIETATSLGSFLKEERQKDESLLHRLTIQDKKIGELIDNIEKDTIKE